MLPRQRDELVVHRRQALEDLLGRKARGNVQVHATVRSATTGLDLRVNRAGDFVARQQLWRATVVVGVGVRIGQIAVATGNAASSSGECQFSARMIML